ncbi:MaoC family dehydratase N-terminal domain-containing protein [Haloechinothrix sp. LS1_15]|uniref:FAS1-like dehydratase domain-containing protein n=1 Tax=Haloechinothrix sp. LS1_15 TaxID=2652248 RepID=UPI0029475BC8|nr:MaoC family dehydratase N-terminal domain-containing protein [Haloechinothrix sp. LS1_15]MDV6013163.1 MaoC family dehydratase [Haloechinothrix sp. LS1_15]
MGLDQSLIGRSYPPSAVYEVSRAKIVEFADALGDVSPLSRDPEAAREAGYPDVIAPPTFLTIVNLGAIDALAADPELGLDYSRMVHGDQSFTHRRPVHAGDRLRVTTHVDDISSRAGNDFLTLRAEIHAEGGELVCTGTAQLVIRGEA